MQINENLNLSLPLRRDGSGVVTVWGYHTPISREVFEANFRVLSATKAALFAKGRNYAGEVGPQIAALLLRDEAKRDAAERNDVDANGAPNIAGALALLGDLKRLTLVMTPGAAGWEQIPVDVALARNLIDLDDWREAEAGLVFFTCLYSITPRAGKRKMIDGVADVLGASVTSLSPMEYIDFLRTSMQTATTETAAAS